MLSDSVTQPGPDQVELKCRLIEEQVLPTRRGLANHIIDPPLRLSLSPLVDVDFSHMSDRFVDGLCL